VTRAALLAVAVFLAASLLLERPQPAPAIPIFAHRYDVTCAKCHSVIPHLNDFGAAFLASGERIPGAPPGPAVPFAAKINLVDSSENQGNAPGCRRRSSTKSRRFRRARSARAPPTSSNNTWSTAACLG